MLAMLNADANGFDLGLALLLAYLAVLWVSGWLLELLARTHFERAERYAHHAFAYDATLDHYECPQGERLTLDTFDDRNKLAIYKAPASSCNACMLKAFCTPGDEGRRVYRPLAEFHETDIGRFHRGLSLVILAVALAFSAGGLLAWWSKPTEWLLVVATCVSVVLLWLELRNGPEPRSNRTGQGPDTSPNDRSLFGTERRAREARITRDHRPHTAITQSPPPFSNLSAPINGPTA
jgi:hypothetical protein